MTEFANATVFIFAIINIAETFETLNYDPHPIVPFRDCIIVHNELHFHRLNLIFTRLKIREKTREAFLVNQLLILGAYSFSIRLTEYRK